MKIRSIAVLAFMTFAVAACDDKPSAGTAASASAAPKASAASAASTAAEKTTAAAATTAAPAATPAAATGDLGEQGYAMMGKLTTIMVDNAADCDKMAAALTTFFTDNGEMIKKFKAADKTMSPEEKKAHKAKWHDKEKALEEKMGPAMAKCKDSKSVAEAMKSLM